MATGLLVLTKWQDCSCIGRAATVSQGLLSLAFQEGGRPPLQPEVAHGPHHRGIPY